MLHQESIRVSTAGRGTYDLTAETRAALARSRLRAGLCTLFIRHTSASLILCENADPTVRSDLESWFARAIPDGDRLFEHTAEGPDDMPAHVRSVLTQSSLSIPVAEGRLALGTWQGVYLWEHRLAGHRREVLLTLVGE